MASMTDQWRRSQKVIKLLRERVKDEVLWKEADAILEGRDEDFTFFDSVDQMRKRWPDIVKEAKRDLGVEMAAHIVNGQPAFMSEVDFTLSFQHKVHIGLLTQRKKERLERFFSRFFPTPKILVVIHDPKMLDINDL